MSSRILYSAWHRIVLCLLILILNYRKSFPCSTEEKNIDEFCSGLEKFSSPPRFKDEHRGEPKFPVEASNVWGVFVLGGVVLLCFQNFSLAEVRVHVKG